MQDVLVHDPCKLFSCADEYAWFVEYFLNLKGPLNRHHKCRLTGDHKLVTTFINASKAFLHLLYKETSIAMEPLKISPT